MKKKLTEIFQSITECISKELPSYKDIWADKQVTKDEAIEIAESGIWKEWSDEIIFSFGMFQQRLSFDFSRFQEAAEKVLDRPVFTHEFAYRDLLIAEWLKHKPKASFEDVINLIPEEKRIVVRLP